MSEIRESNILLLDRRQFLFAAGAMVLAASPLSLIGCGGGGVGGAATFLSSIGISLPPGTGLTLTNLTLLSSQGEVPITATGKASAKLLGDPSLMVLTDGAGNGVFFGFVDPTDPLNTIDAFSTAVALLYFRMGGPAAPSINKKQILSVIRSHPATITFAGVIANRISADPLAIQKGDSQIATAMETAYTAIGGGHGNIRSGPAPRTPNSLPDLLVQPSGEQSGFEIVQDESSTSVHGINHFRRRCQINVYRVSDTSLDGTAHPYSQAVLVGTPISVDGTTALGFFSTIENLLSGHTAFTPVETSQIILSLQPSTIRTDFEIVVLGASGSSEPAVFSDSRFSGATASWRTAVNRLNVAEALFDIALGYILELWGIRGAFKSDAALGAFIEAIYKVNNPTMKTLLAKAEAGAFPEAIGDLIKLVATSDIISKTIKDALRPYILQLEHEAVEATGKKISEKTLELALKMISAAFFVVGVGLAAGDLAAVGHDLAVSNKAETWTVNLIKPTLILSPKTAKITSGARQTFNVTLPAGTQGTIVYDWTQTSSFATFSSLDNVVGNSIETSSTQVDLVTTGSDTSPITVTVVAMRVGNGGSKTEIGRATATVSFISQSDGADFRLISGLSTRTDSFGFTYHGVFGIGFFEFNISPAADTYSVAEVTGYDSFGQPEYLTIASVTQAQLQVPKPVVTLESFQNQTAQAYNPPNAFYNFFNMGNGKIGMFYRQIGAEDDPLVQVLNQAQLTALVNSGLDYWMNLLKLKLTRS